MTFRRAARVDGNQEEIVKALRRAGAIVKHVHQVKNLFDVIVWHRGVTYCVEIKDGSLPPSARRLTDGEQKTKEALESVGCDYHVITSVDEALSMIR